MKRLLRILLSLVVIFSTTPVFAHTKSETQSVWRVVGSTVHVAYTIPEIEIPRLTKNGVPPSESDVTEYVRKNVTVLHGNEECQRSEDVRAVSASTGFGRFEFSYKCSDAQGMKIHSSAFFPVVPTHVTYAQVITDRGDFISQLLTADQQTLALSTASGQSPLQNASFFQYVGMGIMHISTGYDDQVFLLGLVLISKRVRDLIFVVTGFTVGHSVTLALATLGIIRPHTEYIDALIGLTIALIASENVGDSNHRSGTIASVVGSGLLLMALGKMVGFPCCPRHASAAAVHHRQQAEPLSHSGIADRDAADRMDLGSLEQSSPDRRRDFCGELSHAVRSPEGCRQATPGRHDGVRADPWFRFRGQSAGDAVADRPHGGVAGGIQSRRGNRATDTGLRTIGAGLAAVKSETDAAAAGRG